MKVVAHWKLLVGLLLVVDCGLHAAGGAPLASPRPVLDIPVLDEAPVIDGVMGDAAWRRCALIQGFLDPRWGETLIGCDTKCLYLGVRTELPPKRGLRTRLRRDDDMIHRDDSLELWIAPPGSAEKRDAAGGSYFQIIINNAGAKLDIRHERGSATGSDIGWELKGHRFAGATDSEAGAWDIELALPWAAFGVEGESVIGRDIGLLVVRNWHLPRAQAKYSLAGGGAFTEPEKYPILRPRSNPPLVVRETSLGKLFDPAVYSLDYRLDLLNNAGEPTTCTVMVTAESSDMPTKEFKKKLTLPPGASGEFEAGISPGTFHRDATNSVTVRVTSEDGETIHFLRNVTAGKPRRRQIWLTDETGADSAAAYISYYPSLNRLAVMLDTVSAKDARPTGLRVEVLAGDKQIVTGEFQTVESPDGRHVLELPDLDDGEYTVRITPRADDGAMTSIEKRFKRKHFVWENNVLGKTDKVYAPFLPVTVSERDVNVVMRRYRMNNFGLWDSVASADRELLAAPMTVHAETEGEPVSWREVSGEFVAHRENCAVYAATMESSPVAVSTRSRIEEDGCMRVDMTLKPGASPGPIKRLWVDIPVRDDVAPLWHAVVAGTIRNNPVGLLPAGEGLVWESCQTGNGAMLGTFLPYLWLGGAERGIAFFANNDKNWELADEDSALMLIRENGTLHLRLNLISRPVEIREPRTITFGLMATPAKPMPAGWRNFYEKYPRLQTYMIAGGAAIYWGVLQDFSGKYPAGHDFSVADQMLITRNRRARPNSGFLSEWLSEKIPPNPDVRKEVGAAVSNAFNWMRDRVDAPIFMYYEEHFQDQTSEEWDIFQDEWGTEAWTPRIWKERVVEKADLRLGVRIHTPASYRNFALWYAREWMQRGICLYCDNLFPANCWDPLISDAYVREDGKTQSSAGLWELREYYKRLWKVQAQVRPMTPYPLYKSFHMTNANLVPVLAWGDINFDIEWSGLEGPFGWDVILAETIGRKAGNIPTAYHAIGPRAKRFAANGEMTDDQKRRMVRAEWAMRFVHEVMRSRSNELEKLVRDFGYGDEACEVLNYWNEADRIPSQPRIAVADDQVKWIGLWKPEERSVLLVLVNWTEDKRQAAIGMDPPDGVPLGLWKNAETGTIVDPANVLLNGWEARVIEVSSATEP
ncbi:MAG: DUF6067 family protein [Candidatus Pacebacteria bacterium]|nr:DUF6067 family protein [Candidatus Paceibacterota bacterium]